MCLTIPGQVIKIKKDKVVIKNFEDQKEIIELLKESKAPDLSDLDLKL